MITIEDVLLLVGGKLTGQSDEARGRLHQFFEQEKWNPDDFESWIKECAERGSQSNHSYAQVLQDLTTCIGSRLGFSVEYGRLTGSKQEIAFDGLWKRDNGDVILLEVKTSAWPIESVAQLGSYLRRYATDKSIPETKVFGLYIIGSGNILPIVDQIRGSEYRSVLRVISTEDLLKLWRLKDDLESIGGSGSADARIQTLLLPIDSINVGAIVDIITSVAELRKATVDVSDHNGEPEEDDAVLPWDGGSLLKYLNEATPFQRCLLAALSVTDIDPAPRKLVTDLMEQLKSRFPDIANRTITGMTIAGARGGLKMRRGNKEDIIVEDRGYYSIKSKYRQQVMDWAKSQGLTLTSHPGKVDEGAS